MELLNEIVKIESGRIMISDPCYGLGTWCQAQDVEFPNGEYNAYYKATDESANCIKEIRLVNKVLKVSEEDKIKWTSLENEIGVDSGQAGIFDGKYYEDYHGDDCSDEEVDEEWYNRVCNITCNLVDEEFAGVIDNKGLVSSSGYGDGGYEAYIGKLDDQIVAVKVIFIEDEEDEEE